MALHVKSGSPNVMVRLAVDDSGNIVQTYFKKNYS